MCLLCDKNKMSGADSWVRRFSVDEARRHSGGFTVYNITSVLFPLASPEAVSVVTVWKRYSDICKLQRGMHALHGALHLGGAIPALARGGYFHRFDAEVIEERRLSTKKLLEFIADHRLLFTSAEFVNFLQSGYDEPKRTVGTGGGVINTIRSALHLPVEETPPLEYQSDDDTAPLTPGKVRADGSLDSSHQEPVDDDTQLNISEIQVFEATDVEYKQSPPNLTTNLTISDSLDSLTSCSGDAASFYDELDNMLSITANKLRPLPDLISFPPEPASTPCTGNNNNYNDEDEHSASPSSATTSAASARHFPRLRRSLSRQSAVTWAGEDVTPHARTTEDSYVFEAGYLLSVGARCEDLGDFARAFACYKSGIECMLLGVQNDSDQTRRSIIKEKTTKYLAYAEAIYNDHLSGENQMEGSLELDRGELGAEEERRYTLPASMLRQSEQELSSYRVLCVDLVGGVLVCGVHDERAGCLHMKVIQKIPNNRTDADVFPRPPDTKTPVLPTNVPYMVQLRAYIETEDLLFLVLDHAPGGRLVDHIHNYIRSAANDTCTPTRRPNLHNVFTEPSRRNSASSIGRTYENNITTTKLNDNRTSLIRQAQDEKLLPEVVSMDTSVPRRECRIDEDVSVSDLVMNSQRLLLNVNDALSDSAAIGAEEGSEGDGGGDGLARVKNVHVLDILKEESEGRGAMGAAAAVPPAAVRRWGAELLTAVEHLHNAGVVCRELSAEHVLLGEGGHLVLAYVPGYDRHVFLARLALRSLREEPSLYVAPELYAPDTHAAEADAEKVCDWWSFGAIMYELICHVPLSHYHRGVFTSHTMLQLPEGLPLHVESFLTQLLTCAPAERLGARGVHEIKSHPYFRDIDWTLVRDSWRAPD